MKIDKKLCHFNQMERNIIKDNDYRIIRKDEIKRFHSCPNIGKIKEEENKFELVLIQ